MTQTPSIGWIVHYKLSEADVFKIRASRWTPQDAPSLARGNQVNVGDVFPALVVRVYPFVVSLRVFLDGTDDLWATSRAHGDEPGQWAWPTVPAAKPDAGLHQMAVVASTIIKPGEGILLRTTDTLNADIIEVVHAEFARAGFTNPLVILGPQWSVTQVEADKRTLSEASPELYGPWSPEVTYPQLHAAACSRVNCDECDNQA